MANPKEFLRWNRLMIARELCMDSRTVGKRLSDCELEKKSVFTTKEVFMAMVGDLGAEKLRLTREQADKLAMENAEKRGQLLDAKQVAGGLNRAIGSIKSYILGLTQIPEEDRDEIVLKCKALYESALNASGADAGDMESAAAPNG